MKNPNSSDKSVISLAQPEQANSDNWLDVFKIDGFYNPETESWEWFDE
jgi:hypothetical protein